ncbi:Cytochrome P450 monooygenase 3 [Erysiphe neolycopersici]|uniref:Cytochrome P450 monooygenase 3 n=1 Tax=Erysiphe neolycopersici TaxID=212602 RepID=A0A420HE19_9PEZI|nr:Cytochrome P450 monooygenase 3 [Erysiphe neolycopersici]
MSSSEIFPNIRLVSTSPMLLGTTIILGAILLFRYMIFQWRMSRFPIVGNPKTTDFRTILEEGYPDSPFTVLTDPPSVILPKSTINDLKNISEVKASFWDKLKYVFHSNISGFPADDKILTTVVKHEITRIVPSTTNLVQEETAISFKRVLGPCEDWTSHNIYSALSKVVALVSGRVFVGLPLSRDEKWVDVTVNYTLKLNALREALLGWPEWAIKLFGTYMKDYKSFEDLHNRAEELVKPLHNAYLAGEAIEEKQSSTQDSKEKNAIAWFLDRMTPDERKDPKKLSNQLFDLAFVAIHTTSATMTHAVLDLATHREYIPILVDEINTVIAEDGCEILPDGIPKIGKSTMSKLVKLDSFLKESIQVNPLFIASLIRILKSDLKISNGITIPRGTHVAVPSWVINIQSSALHSPGLTKPLNEFDGLRFYKLRQLPGNEYRHFSVSTSADSLIFGHGIHACPGRFFACNEIKIALIELLCNWDFRLHNDIKMEGGKMKRPMNITVEFQSSPNPQAMFEFRRKKN